MRAAALLVLLGGACATPRLPPPPEEPPVREVRESVHPGGATRSTRELLVHADGRIERDGFEREFGVDGRLLAERGFARDVPVGTWREWYPDGTPRSEVAFGAVGSSELLPSRYWHANGRLAAEGPCAAGVREGEWSYFDERGTLLRRGSYRGGVREGAWSFFRADGTPEAEGRYAQGVRVGEWTLWDEQGVPHRRGGESGDPR